MDFAVSTSILRDRSLLDAIEMIYEHGFGGVELWAEHLWNDTVSLSDLNRALDTRRMTRFVHAATRDLNLVSINRGVRQESLRQALQSLELAADIGAGIVTVHPGRMSSSKDDPADFWEMQIEAFQTLCRRACELGVHVGVENMEHRPKELVIEAGALNRMVEAVAMPNFGVTLDLAHAFTLARKKGSQTAEIMDAMGCYLHEIRNVIHGHISDSDEMRTHVPLGLGRMDLRAVFSMAAGQFNVTWVIEGYARGGELMTLAQNRRMASALTEGAPERWGQI